MNDDINTNAQITCIGLGNVDVIARVSEEFMAEHHIAKGESNLFDACAVGNILSKLDNPVISAGGCAANTAFGLAQYGLSVRFIGKTGDDSYADIFRADFKQSDVDFETPPYFQKMTSTCLIMVTPDKERSFAICMDSAGWNISDNDLPDLPDNSDQYVYIEANTAKMPSREHGNILLAALHKYCGGKRRVMINLNDMEIIRETRETLAKALQMDVFFFNCNIHELSTFFEAETAAQALKSALISGKNFAVTDGPQGVYLVQKGHDEIIHIPSLHILENKIINTAGAGDQFAAGFIAGIANGKNPDNACVIGTEAASRVIQSKSARPKKK